MLAKRNNAKGREENEFGRNEEVSHEFRRIERDYHDSTRFRGGKRQAEACPTVQKDLRALPDKKVGSDRDRGTQTSMGVFSLLPIA